MLYVPALIVPLVKMVAVPVASDNRFNIPLLVNAPFTVRALVEPIFNVAPLSIDKSLQTAGLTSIVTVFGEAINTLSVDVGTPDGDQVAELLQLPPVAILDLKEYVTTFELILELFVPLARTR